MHAHISQITPFLHVPDLEAALHLLTQVLGFELLYREPDYAYLEWGPAALRVLQERGKQPVPSAQARMTVYIDVVNVDVLYAQLQPQLASLPPDDVIAPVNQSWGQREFHVRLPDGHWLAFGAEAEGSDACDD